MHTKEAENLLERKWDLTQDWRWQIKNRITDIELLPSYPMFREDEKRLLSKVCKRFHMAITPYYASLINWDDPKDPLFMQSVPSISEITLRENNTSIDPLGENDFTVHKGLIHRYEDRAVLVLTNFCPMYCRFCTRRREWSRHEKILNKAEIDQAILYIKANDKIRDVIISGGDPLTLSLSYLEYLLKNLRKISHVEIIRIGTRVPVVLPQRIDSELLNMLDRYGPIWLNTQFNHPREITSESKSACDLILRHGIPINNQSVLLKGVNDKPELISELNNKLLKIKVRPYYLFQCDQVLGTEYFRTSIFKGIEIIEYLRKHSSGLAVPTYAIDVPGKGGKIALMANHIMDYSDTQVILKDNFGENIIYNEPLSNRLKKNTIAKVP